MRRFLLCYIFILLASCLTLCTHFPLLPKPASSSNLAAKGSLLNNPKYLLFMNDLNKITNEAGYVLRQAEFRLGKNSPPSLISNLKKYNAGLEAIRKVLIKYQLFVHQQEQICPNPSAFNKSEIYRYIHYTEQHQTAVLAQIAAVPRLLDLLQTTNKIKQLSDNFIKHLKSTLEGSFCNLPKPLPQGNGSLPNPPAKKYYKNNLEVSNWYYGSTNVVKYKAYLLKKAANFNLTSCPSALPFIRDDEQTCFNCPPGSIYNLGAEKCDSCRPGKMLNVGTGTCTPCYGEMFIINHQFVCKACAIQSQELFNPETGKCYTCKPTEYLNATRRACMPIKCPPSQPRFNRELAICQVCPLGETLSPTDPSKCLSKCTKHKPLYNNATGLCSQCPKDQRYSYTAKACKNGIQFAEDKDNQEPNQNENEEQSQQKKPQKTRNNATSKHQQTSTSSQQQKTSLTNQSPPSVHLQNTSLVKQGAPSPQQKILQPQQMTPGSQQPSKAQVKISLIKQRTSQSQPKVLRPHVLTPQPNALTPQPKAQSAQPKVQTPQPKVLAPNQMAYAPKSKILAPPKKEQVPHPKALLPQQGTSPQRKADWAAQQSKKIEKQPVTMATTVTSALASSSSSQIVNKKEAENLKVIKVEKQTLPK